MGRSHLLGIRALIPVGLLLSAFSLPSGIALLLDPSGNSIGGHVILPYLTKSLPFLKDFTAVGIFLIVVYGLLPIILSYGLWTQRKWAWTLTLLLGVRKLHGSERRLSCFTISAFSLSIP